MKRVFLALVLIFSATSGFADYYETRHASCNHAEMRAALDRATADKRAVITVVKCDNTPRMAARPIVSQPVVYDDCGMSRVVNREYFVRETVQTYRPVINYVPADRYDVIRPVCNDFGC